MFMLLLRSGILKSEEYWGVSGRFCWFLERVVVLLKLIFVFMWNIVLVVYLLCL